MKRTTHQHDGDLVVFLIGMQIHQPWRVRACAQAFRAMPRMLRELSQDPNSGLLGARTVLERRGPTVIQYWSSAESLYAYAGNPNKAHRPAWTDFYRTAKRYPGAVGIWHETYVVERAESLYGSVAAFGLAAATSAVPVGSGNRTAAKRLGQTTA